MGTTDNKTCRLLLWFVVLFSFVSLWSLPSGVTSAAPKVVAEKADGQADQENTDKTKANETKNADDAWPPCEQIDGNALIRGPGRYLSLVKIGLLWGLFIVWVAFTGWVSRDCREVRLPRRVWLPVVFFPFLLGFFFFGLLFPLFLIGYPLLLACVGVPVGMYVTKRNRLVSPDEQVFTSDHFRQVMAGRAQSLGVPIEGESGLPSDSGPPVKLVAMGGVTDRDNAAHRLTARQSPGYVVAKELIADALAWRADRVMLDYTREAVAVRYQIDGVWHDAPARDRESGDMMLAVFKLLASLDPTQRQAKQSGVFGSEYQGVVYTHPLHCQGTQTGERAILWLQPSQSEIGSLGELGMREKMQEQLRELLLRPKGMLLFSAMPKGGLSTTIATVLQSSDRLMRDFVAVESLPQHETEIENVEVETFDGMAGETPADVLPAMLKQNPDVVVSYDLLGAETVRILSEAAVGKQLVLAGIPAKEAVEALLRVLLLKGPADKFASAITAVINQRLVRKLCDHCKQAYVPPPELLKKLGIPAGRVEAFYRPHPSTVAEGHAPIQAFSRRDHAENAHPICPHCRGIGYHGRTAIYELLLITDAMRTALIKQPKLEVLRQVAQKAGHHSLQDEGLLLVVQGVTALPELMRVLKQ